MKYKWLMGILVLLAIVPLGMYLNAFRGGLSEVHSAWGAFGSFFGGVVSPIVSVLAFIGLLYSMDQTKKQFSEQIDESTFFSLLNFHVSKIEQLSDGEHKGYELFKYLSLKFNEIYKDNCLKIARTEIINNTSNLPGFAYDFLGPKISSLRSDFDGTNKEISEKYFQLSSDKYELLKCIYNTNSSEDDSKRIFAIGDTTVRKLNSSQRINKLKEIYNDFYHEYGHIVGHYFRNIHYLMKHFDESEHSIKYSKIFRAQLSRFELTLMFYNMTSEFSSVEFNDLIAKYNILNGLYEFDLCYQPESDSFKHDLKLLSNMS